MDMPILYPDSLNSKSNLLDHAACYIIHLSVIILQNCFVWRRNLTISLKWSCGTRLILVKNLVTAHGQDSCYNLRIAFSFAIVV